MFVPKLTPLVSILVENVPTPLTTKSSKSVCPSTSKLLVTDTFPSDAILNLVAALVVS